MTRLVLVAILLWSPSHTWARGAGDAAVAEDLFQQALELMKQKRFAKACPKLEESVRLDRGIGALWHLARCYESLGKYASAWARYVEVAGLARAKGTKAQARAARKRASSIKKRISRLTIEVPASTRVTGLVVELDATKLTTASWNTAVPIDHGLHTIRASAPGHKPWVKQVRVPRTRVATRKSVRIPELESAARDTEPTPPTRTARQERRVRPPPTPPPTDERTPRWYRDKMGWTVVATGAALAIGGLLSMSHAGTLEDDAGAATDLDERDDLFDRSDTFRTTGGALLVIGGAALVAGVVKLAVVPKPRQSASTAWQPQLLFGRRGIMVRIGGGF